MKLTVLTENTALNENLLYEHGLSFYIETERHKILFDMGQSDVFIKNAKTLGINLEAVDIAFVSHGHYDHGGGLSEFLKINSRAKVYINENAFKGYYSVDGRYLGLDTELKDSERIILTGDECRIDDELYLFTGNERKREFFMDTFGLLEENDGNLTPDKFLHEQYLLIKYGTENILISGCSHKGIMNILGWVADKNVRAVFGGFHFMKLSSEIDGEYLTTAAERLSDSGATFYTCHCTGEEQYEYMKKLMKNKLEYVCAGAEIPLVLSHL